MPIASSLNVNNKPDEDVVSKRLLPDEVTATLPKLYATENDNDPIAQVKLFFPAGHYTAFLTEYDPKSKIAFGWAEQFPGGGELGYLSIDELQSIMVQGVRIERDEQFTPRPLSQAIDEFQNGPTTRVNNPQFDINKGRERG